jgi:spoIIIJ-associated protein
MIKEFEGASKEEAVEKAAAELGINKEEFDVEILEETKGFLFSKGKVTIRVHVEEEEIEEEVSLSSEHEADVIEFLEAGSSKRWAIVQKSPSPAGRTTSSIWTSIPRTQTFLSAKRGKNLDALQLLANVYLGKILDEGKGNLKIVLDAENYRWRREDTLVRMALKTAQIVKKTRKSKMLEPMNPFERRLIHTALNDMQYIQTESEGNGLMKQIKVRYVGPK